MNAPNPLDDRAERLLNAACNDTLSPEEVAELERLLAGDEALRRRYLQLFNLQGELAFLLRAEKADRAARAQIAAECPPPAAPVPRRRVSPLLGFLDRLPTAIHPVHHPVWFFVTTAVLTSLFWGLLVWNIWPRGGDAPAGIAQRDRTPIPFIARLTHVEEVVWGEGAERFHPGAYLAAGQRLELAAGRLHVLFGDGARMAVEGPAALRIDSRKGLTLDAGRALARVEGKATARGFRVETPHAELIDQGTEFGVEVRQVETEVQVFEGKVEVLRADDPRDRGRRLAAGEAAVFGSSPQQGFYVKEKKMNRAIYLSLAAVLSLPIAAPAHAAILDDFNSNSSALYTLSQSFGSGGAFNVAGGTLNLATAANNTVAVMRNDGTFVEVGQSWAIDDLQHANSFFMVSTIAAQPDGTASFGFRLRRDNDGFRIHRYSSGTSSQSAVLANPVGPLTMWIDRVSATDFEFYYEQGAGRILLGTDSLLPTEAVGNFFIGAQAFANSASTFSFDNLRFLPDPVVVEPVPEPATGAALGLGGLLLWGALRRRRNR